MGVVVPRLSLRARWVFGCAVAAAAVACLFAAWVLLLTQREAQHDTDRLLRAQVRATVATLLAQGLSEDNRPLLLPPDRAEPLDWSVQLLGPSRDPLLPGPQTLLAGAAVPGSLPMPQAGSEWPETVDVPGPGGGWRLAQSQFRTGSQWWAVRVLHPQAPLQQAFVSLAREFALGLLVLLALSGGVGWWVAGRALRPLKRISAQLGSIHAGQLALRVPADGPPDEVQQLARQVNAMLARLQTAFQRRARFAADVAHELRTPLAAQRAVGEMALAARCAPASAAMQEAVISMLDEGRHMERLIDGLLTLARASGADDGALEEDLDAAALVADCAQTLRVLADEKRQRLTVQALGKVPIRGDRTLLRQAILNILHNAIQHCPAGTRIDVSARAAGPHAVMAVSDNGPGIAEQEQGEIFCRFRRGRRTANADSRGLGLGLAIAKALVDAQGGRITLRSQSGVGCSFEMVFPLAARGAGLHAKQRAPKLGLNTKRRAA